MCTVTYIPQDDGLFTITQNRDVNPTRYAREIIKEERKGTQIIYPRDMAGGGTWISASNLDQFFCVINGAFHPHQMDRTYRMSRGLVALQFYDFPGADEFFTAVDLIDIEPFTMIVYDRGPLYEFRWDGRERHVHQVDSNRPHLWASSTLYNDKWQRRRQFWFERWYREKKTLSGKAIFDFHQTAGDGDPENDLVMNRNGIVRTVSITTIERRQDSIHLQLNSLMSDIKLEGLVQWDHGDEESP